MKKKFILLMPVVITFTAAVFYGCATQPVQLQSVENARSEYQQAAQDEDIKQNASVALYEAEQQLQKLNTAINEQADVAELDHLAYLVQQRVDIAKATAQQNMASSQINELNKERAQIRMELRQAEVKRAQEKADLAAMEAEREKQRVQTLQQQLQNIQSASLRQEPRGTVISLGDVFFDFDKATLKSGAVQNLDVLVRYLKENPQRNIVIEGFTDSIGQAAYNQELSQKRAQSVIGYLVSQGISEKRLTARGYGEAFPVATNEEPGGRQLNRRVEVVVLREGQQPATAGRAQQQAQEVARFSEIDRDNNGYLSKEETRKMQSLRNNFEQYDQNRDQQLNRSEFSAFEEMEIQQQQEQKAQGQ
jgi:outer membrane protein OmpA-like peptidoglycan-associated protein